MPDQSEKELSRELIERYFQGDAVALDELVRHFLAPVHQFITRTVGRIPEADDLAQETFLKAWRQLKRFDTTRSFKAWLFAIARNTCIDYLRKKKAVPISAFDDAEGNNVILETLRGEEPDAEELFDSGLVKEMLGSLVHKLTPAYQKVVTMRYENDFTFQEMSDILGESVDTLKSRYRRALVFLKKELINRQK